MGFLKNMAIGTIRMGAAIALAVTPLAVTGCTTHLDKSYTFVVDTGEDVKVTLDLKSGYDLSQEDGTFTVTTKDGDGVVSGVFVNASEFHTYKQAIDEGSFDGTVDRNEDSLLSWTYSSDGNEERNRCVLVSDDTAVLMGSIAEAGEAEQAYDALSFEIA